MTPILTFIIPVRHPQNAKDWGKLKKNLTQTMRSIAAQTHPGWRGIVVANHGSDLPSLPQGFEAKFVDFLPNPNYERADDIEAYYEAVRLDKGRRILSGLYSVQGSGHVMVVDDDDLIHRDLVAFSALHPRDNGWSIKNGYLWDEGYILYMYDDFSRLCGTSHIVRKDLFNLPQNIEDVSDNFISRMIGSHIFIEEELKKSGTPLAHLPFIGAIYRVGHSGAHSRSQGIMPKYFFGPEAPRNPLRLLWRLRKLRFLSPKIRKIFFGD